MQHSCKEGLEILIELGSEWRVVGKLRELAIDCPDYLDIVVADELQVLLLVLLRSCCKGKEEFLVQSALLILLPIGKLEVILSTVAK